MNKYDQVLKEMNDLMGYEPQDTAPVLGQDPKKLNLSSDYDSNLEFMNSLFEDSSGSSIPQDPSLVDKATDFVTDTFNSAVDNPAEAAKHLLPYPKPLLDTVSALGKGAAQFTIGTPIAAYMATWGAVYERDASIYSDLFEHLNNEIGRMFEASNETEKTVQGAIGAIFEKGAELSTALADANFEATQSPEWATSVRVMGESLMYALPYVGAKGLKPLAGSVVERVKLNRATKTAKQLGIDFEKATKSQGRFAEAETLQWKDLKSTRDPIVESYLPDNGLNFQDFRRTVKQIDKVLDLGNVKRMWEEYKNPVILDAYKSRAIRTKTPAEYLADEAGGEGFVMTPVWRARYVQYVNKLLPEGSRVKTYNAAVNRAMELRAQEAVSAKYIEDTKPIREKVKNTDSESVDTPLVEEVAKESVKQAKKAKGEEATSAEEPLVSGKQRSLTGTITEAIAGQSITPIRKLGQRAPTAKVFADLLWRPERGDPTAAKTLPYYHASRIETGKFLTRLNDALEPVQGKILYGVRKVKGHGAVPKGKEQAVINYLRGVRGSYSSEVMQAGKNIRKWLDDIYGYSKKVMGEEFDKIENFFPRMYRLKESMREDWVGTLSKYGMDAAEAEALFDHILENKGRIMPFQTMLRIRKGRTVLKASNVDYARQLRMIPDEELAPFLNNNLYEVLTKYAEDSVHRVEFARRFGKNLEIADKMIEQIVKEASESGKPISKWELDRLYDELDAWQGIYKADKTNSLWKKLQRAHITFMNMPLLQLSTLASVPEAVYPISEFGLQPWIKAMPKAVDAVVRSWARQLYRDIPKSHIEKLAEEIQKAGTYANMDRMHKLMAGDYTSLGNLTFRMNGLYYWTEISNYIALSTYDTFWKGYFKALSKGKENLYLSRHGVSSAELQQMAEYYNINLKDAIGWVSGGMNPKSIFYRNYKAGALTFAEDNVMAPNPANTPMWHSNPNFAIIRHLKSFPTLMTNQLMKRWIKGVYKTKPGLVSKGNYAMNIAIAVSLMLLTGNIIIELKDHLKYGGSNPAFRSESKALRLMRIVEQVGLIGTGSYIWDTVTNYRTSLFDIVFGPDISTDVKLIAAAAHLISGDNARPLARELARITPVANITKKGRERLVEEYENGLIEIFPWVTKHGRGLMTKMRELK